MPDGASVHRCTLLGRPRSPVGSKATSEAWHVPQLTGKPWAAGGARVLCPEGVVMPLATGGLLPQRAGPCVCVDVCEQHMRARQGCPL